MRQFATVIDEHATALVADCANCVGLCCVALAFTRSDDFAFDKSAGEECRNLTADYRCRVHSSLRSQGMKGCTAFDCHGAGQRVSRVVLGGTSWRDSPARREQMFAVFRVVRQLHEMLWYLSAAARATNSFEVRAELEATYAWIDQLGGGPADEILNLDLTELHDRVNPLLAQLSETVRADGRSARGGALPSMIRSGADLVGVSLQGRDLRGADLRGALLMAADLSGADLRGADLIAADLRDTDLRSADLSTALFITQMQLNAARGNHETRIPLGTARPSHWTPLS